MWTVRVVSQTGETIMVKRGLIRPMAASWAKTFKGTCIILETVREYRIILETVPETEQPDCIGFDQCGVEAPVQYRDTLCH